MIWKKYIITYKELCTEMILIDVIKCNNLAELLNYINDSYNVEEEIIDVEEKELWILNC